MKLICVGLLFCGDFELGILEFGLGRGEARDWNFWVLMESISLEEDGRRGSMWDLDQRLDQPMDEEAGRLRTMYREKVFI